MNGVLVDEVREKSSSPGEDAKTELQQTKPPATNDKSPAAASTPVIEDGKEEVDIEEEDVNNSQEPISVEPDILGFYTLSFCNKSKDLSERKIRLDFANVEGLNQGSVLRVRGLAGLSKNEIGSGETINVSFVTQEAAETAANAPAIREKYSRLRCAPAVSLVPNKEGHFSVDFINSGMSGMREITTEFSKFGEVAKVMAGGGAKNAVKKVTVSFGSKESAFNAVKAQGNSKDFVSCDFSKDCIA